VGGGGCGGGGSSSSITKLAPMAKIGLPRYSFLNLSLFRTLNGQIIMVYCQLFSRELNHHNSPAGSYTHRAEWWKNTHAAPVQRSREIVASAKRQDGDRWVWLNVQAVNHGEHPARSAVSATDEYTQVGNFAVQLQADTQQTTQDDERLSASQCSRFCDRANALAECSLRQLAAWRSG